MAGKALTSTISPSRLRIRARNSPLNIILEKLGSVLQTKSTKITNQNLRNILSIPICFITLSKCSRLLSSGIKY